MAKDLLTDEIEGVTSVRLTKEFITRKVSDLTVEELLKILLIVRNRKVINVREDSIIAERIYKYLFSQPDGVYLAKISRDTHTELNLARYHIKNLLREKRIVAIQTDNSANRIGNLYRIATVDTMIKEQEGESHVE